MSAPENSAQKTREKSQIRLKYYFRPIFLRNILFEIVSVTNKVGIPREKDKMLSNFLPRKEGMLLLPCLLYAIHLASYSDGGGGLTWPFFGLGIKFDRNWTFPLSWAREVEEEPPSIFKGA